MGSEGQLSRQGEAPDELTFSELTGDRHGPYYYRYQARDQGGDMGQFIVIEVDKDEVAQTLVDRFAGKSGLRVVGRFQRPRAHCPHPLSAGGYSDAKQVARGAKYGWWLHNVTGCKRPRRGSHQLENLIGVEEYPVVDGSTYTQKVSTLHVFDVPTGNLLLGDVDPA